MNLELSEEQRMMRRMARKLMLEKVGPRAAEIDETGEFPWDVKQLLAENDILGLPIPPEYGGVGASLLTHCIVIEEIARVCAASSMILGNQSLGSTPIFLHGSEAQKQKYGPRLASGEWLPSFALTEPGAGSDVSSIATRAVPDGSGFLINGVKCFITQGNLANLYCVFAQTPVNGKNRLTGFAVERTAPGISIGKIEHKMGLRGSPTAEVVFRDVWVPGEAVIGDIGDGYRVALGTLDKGRPSVAAQAVGLAQGALDLAVEYAKTRIQFGVPIIQHQGIQFILADMETEIQAARHLTYVAADKYDRHAPDRSRFSAMCKLFATDMVMRVTTNAVQVLGGYGYMRDFAVERTMRDAKVFAIFEGTNQIQRIVIARALAGPSPEVT